MAGVSSPVRSPNIGVPHMRIVLPKTPSPTASPSPQPACTRELDILDQRNFASAGMLVRLHPGQLASSSREHLVMSPRAANSRRLATSRQHKRALRSCLQRSSSESCGSCSSVGSSASSFAASPSELPPTSAEEKGRIFRGYLTVILSCVYAVFLVTLGLVIYISDLVLGDTPMAETFSIYLVVIGLLWFVFLYADIRRYLNSRKQAFVAVNNGRRQNRRDHESFKLREEPECASKWPASNKNIEAPPCNFVPLYCFSQGRHSGSFYLKIGAAGFCFGHLIHSGLLLGYQVTFLLSEDPRMNRCASIPALVLDVLYPTYSFVQLFFIFKYSNVIINHCTELARFTLMHCIASSLCFWVWTILRETVDSLSHLHHQRSMLSAAAASVLNFSTSHEPITPLPLTTVPVTEETTTMWFAHQGAREIVQLLNDSSLLIDSCRGASKLSDNLENFSPYLYPFTIEYSILVVGVLFIIWQNIGRCHTSSSTCPGCRQLPTSYEAGFTSNVVLHADCHSANKGLFAGLIVLVGSAVSIILFFVAMADRAFVGTGLMVNAVTELTLLVLMTIAVIVAYRQMTKLDINKYAVSLLDDLLLFICIPAFFLYAIFSIMPAVHMKNYLSMTTILLQVLQVLLQTPFIIDGLRRCSNSRSLRLAKPGRELVTFLVVCNVAMWIIETFEIKSQDVRDDRFHFYGSVLWTMLSHMTLPLTMFYRFHSSVCLVDIWKSAYEPGEREKH